ncbi:MAG: discoidin domain-containing protein [Oscillospiraceae bacterium]|nr:discoidin domain-containing protein [Oscillospiraceae bacterium]
MVKKKHFSRVISIMLTVAMILPLFVFGAPVEAADSWPFPGDGAVAENQPWVHGHRVVDLIDWEPGVDPFASYLRAEVPLQTRIGPYSATQAIPELEFGPQLYWMASDYGNSFQSGTTHNNVFSEQILTHWQYVDMWTPWHGAMQRDTPRWMWNEMENGSWTRGRMFDFGTIAIPNAAYTNAARRNGALSLAKIYFDDNNRVGQPACEMVFLRDEDGRYVIGDMMIELAHFYGFDGWFFNYEANLHTTSQRTQAETVTELKKLMQQITDAGLHTNIYSTMRLNGTFSGWHSTVDTDVWSFLVDPTMDPAGTSDDPAVLERPSVNSIFVNYDWSSASRSLNHTNAYVNRRLNAMGITDEAELRQWRYDHLFYGVEVNKGEMSSSPNSVGDDVGGHNSVWNFIRNDRRGTSAGADAANASVYIDAFNENPTLARRMQGSVVLFTPEEFTHRRLGDWGRGQLHQMDDYQWIIDQRDRMYFSGNLGDPTRTRDIPEDFERPEIGLPRFYHRNTGMQMLPNGQPMPATHANARDTRGWFGVADFITERSVIHGTNFFSNFNTGRGLEYRIGGVVSNDESWSNMNLQDIMPSWQWWVETAGDWEDRLQVEWDYGPQFVKRDFRTANYSNATLPAGFDSIAPGTSGDIIPSRFNQIGAYIGGNSVALFGDLKATNEWNMFKTELNVNANSVAEVTFNKTSDDNSAMSLRLTFNGGGYALLPVYSGGATDGWVTEEISLAAHTGRTIAAISLVFTGEAEDFQMNIGRLVITDGIDPIPAPSNVSFDAVFNTREIKLTWDLDPFEIVNRYHIYAVYGEDEVFVGGIYGSQFYIKSVEENLTAIRIRGVGADGTEGPATTLNFSFGDNVSNIVIAEAARQEIRSQHATDRWGALVQTRNEGRIEARWTAPANNVNFDGYELVATIMNVGYSNTTHHSTTVPATATSAVVEVRGEDGRLLNNGERYILRIYTTLNGVRQGYPIAISGYLRDNVSDDYDGVLRFSRTANQVRIGNPTSRDWWRIEVSFNGSPLTLWHRHTLNTSANGWPTGWRGVVGLSSLLTIPSRTEGTLSITLVDYSHNRSTVHFDMSILRGTDTDTRLEDIFPDPAVHSAIKAQVGDDVRTLGDLHDVAMSITELDLSNRGVTDLTGLNRLVALESLNLSGNAGLTRLHAEMFPTSLKELNISGLTNLEILDVSNRDLERIDHDFAEVPELMILNISGNKLDLRAGTPARTLVNAAYRAHAINPGPTLVWDTETTNLALGRAAVPGSTMSSVVIATLFNGNRDNGANIISGVQNDTRPFVTIDLGAPSPLSGYGLWHNTSIGASPVNRWALEGSLNNETWFPLGAPITDGAEDGPSGYRLMDFAEEQTARFVRFTVNPQPNPDDITNTAFLRQLEIYGLSTIMYEHLISYDNQRFDAPPTASNVTNPAHLNTLLQSDDVVLQTRGNLGIFAQHSPLIVPAGRTLYIETTLNIQRDAELIIRGTVVVLDGGRINNQGSPNGGGTITIAEGGTLVNNGHVENVSNSAVFNYGTITNNGRFEVRAGTMFIDDGYVDGDTPLRIHRDAILERPYEPENPETEPEDPGTEPEDPDNDSEELSDEDEE